MGSKLIGPSKNLRDDDALIIDKSIENDSDKCNDVSKIIKRKKNDKNSIEIDRGNIDYSSGSIADLKTNLQVKDPPISTKNKDIEESKADKTLIANDPRPREKEDFKDNNSDVILLKNESIRKTGNKDPKEKIKINQDLPVISPVINESIRK